MGITNYGTYQFVPIRSSETCPICGSRKGRCSQYVRVSDGQVIYYKCHYAQSNNVCSDGSYKHYTNNKFDNIPTKVNLKEVKQITITEEDLILRDKVYREMRNLFYKYNKSYLYQNHYQNLIERGFDDKEIRNMGFFSVPKNERVFYNNYHCSLRTAIVKELEKKFTPQQLLKVPGFLKKTNKNLGSDYVIFKNVIYNKEIEKFEDLDAYFIPYYNSKGLLIGLQYRLMKKIVDERGKAVRYLWYASKNVTCGSPIDYYTPMTLSYDDVILVSEGALKTKYAASHLGLKSLAEAGVGNYHNLIKTLQEVEKLECRKYKILLALDMDKYSNTDVIRAEISTVSLLKGLGYSVTIVEWNESEGKGIDDKILNTGVKGFRFLPI